MSDIQEDKKTLENRKKMPKEFKAPLKDRIEMGLFKRLDKEKFGHKVVDAWHKENNRRSAWLQRQQAYQRDWDNFVDNGSDGPFEGSSQLHLPTSFTIVKTYHARMMQAIRGNQPNPKPRRPDAVERQKTVQAILEYCIKDWANKNEGVMPELDKWIWRWCAQGVATLKVRWEACYERFVDVVETSQPVIDFVGEGDNAEPVERMDVREEEQERILEIFNGPIVECLDEEDLIVVGGGGDPQKADMVLQQQWLTASQLWSYADQGIFKADRIPDIIRGGKDYQNEGESNNIKQDRAINAGMSDQDSESELDRYRILEVYASKDVDGSGINAEIVAWVHARTGSLLRATYLRRMNRAGKRPFARIKFHERHGQAYPMGLVEILYPYAKEIDAIHNIRIDAGIISNTPMIFYRSGSSIKPQVLQYEPGSMYPVDDPQRDIFIPQFGNKTAFGLQEENQIQQVVERLTGISDLALGANTTQGALRTATGARALMGEANANLDVHLHRLIGGWKRVQQLLLYFMQDRLPEGFEFRLTGEDGQDYFAYINNRNDIAGDFDFEFDPSTADSNPAVRQEKATQVFNTIMNPLLIQLGIVGPRQVYEASKGLVKSFGIQDWAKYVNEPKEQPLIMSPEEEANRLLRGVDVPVTLQGDHEGFIEYLDFIMSKPEMLGQFTEDQIMILVRQRGEHEAMLEALQQLQAQQANLRQMQSNAAQSAQQAPTAPEGAQTNPVGGQ